MVPYQVMLAFLFLQSILVLALQITEAKDQRECQQFCGDRKRNGYVQYPFGFSDGCQIRLNCNNTTREILIDKFRVKNVSADAITVELPVKCNRSIEEIQNLNGKNYAMSWRNSFLMRGCHSQVKGCSMYARAMNKSLQVCGKDNGSISCYFEDVGEFVKYEELKQTNCAYAFSSVLIDGMKENENGLLSLELHTVELQWWLEGNSSCDKNAYRTNVITPNEHHGYRCQCKDGFVGDGFTGVGSDGCRKAVPSVADCSGWKFFSGQCRGKGRMLLIGGIISGASLLIIFGLLYYCLRRRSVFLRNRKIANRLLCETAGGSSVPMFSYKEVERYTNAFSDKQRLGTGAYGTVYAGKLHNGELVAIKKIRHRDTNSIDQVMNEIKLLSSVSHQHLVRLLGCCIENGEQILVYEYMANGTLSQHLQRERGNGLPWTIRLTIATETAHAIAHLHTAIHPPIYHRDIKSSNILLDYNFNSKIADFGLSRFGMLEDSHISTAPQGTPGYVDPQYHQNFHLSDKSDVYSFGVVLVEIITALKVVDFSRSHSEINLAALAIERIGKGRVDEIIDPFLDPHRDAWTLSSIHKVAELSFRCLAFHRDMRPSMIEVADELEQIRLSGWAPLEENICMMSSVASSCSSPCNGSEKSIGGIMPKKTLVGSWNLIVPQRPDTCLTPMEVVQESSPVSVQDVWQSEESSPSTNSLLGHAAR